MSGDDFEDFTQLVEVERGTAFVAAAGRYAGFDMTDVERKIRALEAGNEFGGRVQAERFLDVFAHVGRCRRRKRGNDRALFEEL